jgi:hypothetical protein
MKLASKNCRMLPKRQKVSAWFTNARLALSPHFAEMAELCGFL